LRLFGFGPVAADGYGIGYIIKEDGISMYVNQSLVVFPQLFTFGPFSCASSKHLQTRRFLDTLQGYLYDIQRILVQLHKAANARPAPFVDHLGILRDSKTGRPINGIAYDDEDVNEVPGETPMCEYLVFICAMVLVLVIGRLWGWYLPRGRGTSDAHGYVLRRSFDTSQHASERHRGNTWR
jgi:carnitine O-acetyltransferase